MTLGPEYFTETLGELYEKQGYFQDAKNVYTELIRIDPDNKNILKSLSRIEQKLSGEKRTDVISLVGEWLELLAALKNEGDRVKG